MLARKFFFFLPPSLPPLPPPLAPSSLPPAPPHRLAFRKGGEIRGRLYISRVFTLFFKGTAESQVIKTRCGKARPRPPLSPPPSRWLREAGESRRVLVTWRGRGQGATSPMQSQNIRPLSLVRFLRRHPAARAGKDRRLSAL